MIGMKVIASLGAAFCVTAATMFGAFCMHISHPACCPHRHSLPSLGDFSVLLETRQPDALLLVSQCWVCVGGMHAHSHSIAAVRAVQL